MLNGVNAAQWRKNGMMEVGEGKMVGDVKKKKKKKKKNYNDDNNCYGTENNGMLMIVMVVMMIIMVGKIWCGL